MESARVVRTVLLAVGVCALFSVGACKRKQQPPPAPAEPAAVEPKKAPPEPAPAPKPEPKEEARAEEKLAPADREAIGIHMKDHFTQASLARDALTRGRLKEAQKAATWLASHKYEKELPASWVKKIDDLQAAASDVGKAAEVKEAAAALARMALACGSCHAAVGARPSTGQQPVVPTGKHTRDHMVRHAQAAARLWDGLVMPSDDAWKRGCELMTEGPLDGTTLGTLDVDKLTLAEKIHEQAAKAAKLAKPAERAEAYGQMLGGCASCHLVPEKKGE